MMPRKQWTAFEKVTAADVNASLADQSVMVFATTTARDAAIPSPSTGMQSAVTASPDLGAPRYWDGSAWTLVKSGFLYPNILTLASTALDVGTMRFGPQNMTQNVWYEVTASMPQDSVIFAAVSSSQQGRFEFGIGASGSEVLRLDLGNRMANWPGNGDFPYGVFVASGQRVALRNITTNTVGTDMTFIFATNQTRDAVQQRALQSTNNIGSTSWTEIATTPPVAAGVWVIGYAYYQGSASGGRFRSCGDQLHHRQQHQHEPLQRRLAYCAVLLAARDATGSTNQSQPYRKHHGHHLAGDTHMSTTWFAVLDDTGTLVSTGTVIDADDLAAKGYTWHECEVPDGKVPEWTGTALVAVDPPPPPPPPKTLEEQIADAVAAALQAVKR
jgi:hypothetical protein